MNENDDRCHSSNKDKTSTAVLTTEPLEFPLPSAGLVDSGKDGLTSSDKVILHVIGKLQRRVCVEKAIYTHSLYQQCYQVLANGRLHI